MTIRAASIFSVLTVVGLLAVLQSGTVNAGTFGILANMAEKTYTTEVSRDSKPEKNTEIIQNPPTSKIAVPGANKTETSATEQTLGLLADIRVHSAEELLSTLNRVDELFKKGEIATGTQRPVVFLLHGNEAKTLYIDRYKEHKTVVDLAAKLSAFGVVDIKVCDRWANNRGLDKTNLQPFVGTISFAPAEKRRLLEEQGYIYF